MGIKKDLKRVKKEKKKKGWRLCCIWSFFLGR